MLTNWITSSPYLKTHTTPEVCTPQPEHTTYRRGGIHTHTQTHTHTHTHTHAHAHARTRPLTTGRQWVLQGLTVEGTLLTPTRPPHTHTYTHTSANESGHCLGFLNLPVHKPVTVHHTPLHCTHCPTLAFHDHHYWSAVVQHSCVHAIPGLWGSAHTSGMDMFLKAVPVGGALL